MEEFVARHDLDHVVHVADTAGVVWGAFDVVGQPAWAFVDGETGEATVQFGALGLEGILAAADDLGS